MLRQAIQWLQAEEPTPTKGPGNPMAPEEGTPADVLLTRAERGTVARAVRLFIKGIVPALPAVAKSAGPALVALALATTQHCAGKDDTDRKISSAEQKTTATLETLAPATNEHADELVALKEAIKAIQVTQKEQGLLLLASRPGFTASGKPDASPRTRRPKVDPMLVKKVQANATANLAAGKASKFLEQAPARVPVTLDDAKPATVAPAPAQADAAAKRDAAP